MESREQFLEWFAKEHEEVENSDELAAKVMKMIAWSSWQASRNAVEIDVRPSPFYMLISDRPVTDHYQAGRNSVIHAIRAAGLRVKER